MTHWNRLRAALDARAEAGTPARFWLRDDDAIAPTSALDRLLDVTGAAGVPLVLAVIPEDTGDALANRLASIPHASVAVHGWSHRNHAPAGQKKQELGLHRPAETVLTDLANGLTKLQALHPSRALPLLVPPWNRIDRGLVPSLAGLGYKALSSFGPECPPERPGAIPEVNTHVDLIDWRGSRGGRGDAALLTETLARMDAAGTATTGFLTHHLVHDAAAWGFLARLFDATAGHPGCRWLTGAELLD